VRLSPKLVADTRTFQTGTSCPLHEADAVVSSVVVREDRRSGDWTVDGLLRETAGSHDAALCLDWPMTAAARCESCGHEWEPWLRRARFRRSRCPRCGGRELVEKQVVTEISRTSEWAARTLLTLGLPGRHIHDVVVGHGADRRHVFVEPGGDVVRSVGVGPR
jgi:hypothetical protein